MIYPEGYARHKMPRSLSSLIKLLPIGLFLLVAPLQAAEVIEKVFPVSSHPSLILTSSSGWITIKSWQHQEIKVVYTKYSTNCEVDTEASPNKVRISTHVLDKLARSEKTKIDYQIFAPEESNIEVKTNIGGVIVERIKGEVRIDVVDAAVKIVGVTGFITARSLSSKLEIMDSRGPIQAGTVSGDIIFTRLDSNSVSAQSTQGNILLDGDLVSHGSYNFSTNAGNIQILCTEKASVEFDVKTVRGGIESDLPILSKGHHFVTNNLIGRQSLVGTLNAGEATMQLSTFSGRIRINRK